MIKEKSRSEKETAAREKVIIERVAHDREPEILIEGLDEVITQQAGQAFDNLVTNEGFSEEQANQIALTMAGKSGELMDENFDGGETEDELTVKDLLDDSIVSPREAANSLRKAHLNDH